MKLLKKVHAGLGRESSDGEELEDQDEGENLDTVRIGKIRMRERTWT